MAFDKKDGFSYLDDIPFRVASAFLPPPPVVLPAAQSTSDYSLFENLDYDFALEKKVLEDIKSEDGQPNDSNGVQPDSSLDSSVKSNVQNILSLQSDILLPKPQKIRNKVSNADDQNNSKINLSDFENDTSTPFDYMELQTINDLEELSNVFQGLNNKYSSDNNVYKDKSCVSSGLNQNNLTSNVSKSMSFPLENSDGFENSEKYLTCPKSVAVQGSDTWTTSLSFPKEDSFYPVPSSKMNDFSCSNRGENGSRRLSSELPQVPCLISVTANNINAANGIAASKSPLRGCKSYSDIHTLSEQFAKDFSMQGRPCTPPPFLTADTKAACLSVEDSEVSSNDANCDISSKLVLPDPYDELAEDSRKFVDAITDMGFSRAQVSRTVKHLGTDEKMVVEHLCRIQTFEESGYDCLEAEAALHLHDYNQDQAKKFLDLISKFQDLGFEKNAVKKALIQNKNDWSKTIDALLS